MASAVLSKTCAEATPKNAATQWARITGTGCAAGAVGIVNNVIAEDPMAKTSIGAVPLSNASQMSQVIAIPSAAPTAPITESLLLAFGDGKSLKIKRAQISLTLQQIAWRFVK
jgi:hypothetical protein